MNIILRCLAVICLLLFSLSALGDNNQGSQVVLMFNAGSLNVNVMQLQINDPTNPADDAVEPISIIEERSVGTLGRADLKTFAKVISVYPPYATEERCPDGFPIPLVVTEDTIVLTFHDLSQLVGNAESLVCINERGTQSILANGHWSSGSRRFAGVTSGEFHLRSTATPQSTNGQFYTTISTINGRLER